MKGKKKKRREAGVIHITQQALVNNFLCTTHQSTHQQL